MEQDPGILSGAQGNFGEDVDELFPVGGGLGVRFDEAGQASELRFQEAHRATFVQSLGHFGQNGAKHGNEIAGEDLLPQGVVVAVGPFLGVGAPGLLLGAPGGLFLPGGRIFLLRLFDGVPLLGSENCPLS
jgi:hypothetical protein